MNAEEWRDIEGYEGSYQVSSHGRVKSVARSMNMRNSYGPTGIRSLPERILQTKPGKTGYPLARLYRNGRLNHAHVHRLVARAFLKGTYFDGALALHADGNPLNNNVENLSWGTHSDNLHDCVRHGRHHLARRTHCANGHPFSPENTRVQITKRNAKRRICRICQREKSRIRRERLRANAAHLVGGGT